MQNKQKATFDKAYNKITVLYGRVYDVPDIRIISRFYDEKRFYRKVSFINTISDGIKYEK
jgi:hypothetical protein